MTTHPLIYALLADLLEALEADGALPGTDQHLRLQELLRRLPPETTAEDMKTLLAPVLCKTKDDQERFYELFARSWKRVQEVAAAQDTISATVATLATVRAKKRGWSVAAGVAFLLLLALGIWLAWQVTHPVLPPVLTREEIPLTIGDTGHYRFEPPARSPRIASFKSMCTPADSACLSAQIDTATHQIHYTGLRAGTDSVCLQVVFVKGQQQTHTVVFHVSERDTTVQRDTAAAPRRDTSIYVVRPLPHPINTASLQPPVSGPWQVFLYQYRWPIKGALILLSGLLCWLLAQWIERKRRQLVAEHEPNSKPPYTWDIRLDDEPELAYSERYYALLHFLRQREQDDWHRLDMPKTVKATIAKGGMPEFRYTQRTRPAEYLLLLDRQGARNHRAQLFNLLFKAFRRQEVIIDRFYFDGDPRLCWNETTAEGISLRELLYNHPQARLLLVGDGFGLLNPQTGRLAKWTQVFAGWSDRAILSPQPMRDWGRREQALQEQFLLLPAALSGLQTAIQQFDDLETHRIDLNRRQFPDALWEPIELQAGGLMATLEYYFLNSSANSNSNSNSIVPDGGGGGDGFAGGEKLIQWIAACAVYPELHWDLTLFLGQLLSTPEEHLLTLEHLAQLCRMPWFVSGEIPKEARQTLLAWLEERHPDTLLRVREGLHRLMLHNPPPADSAAHDDYSMNIALNEWLITKDKARKKALEQEIAARLASGQEADITVVKVLDRARSPLDFVVPEAWKKYLMIKGSSLLGVRAWLWLAPLWLLLSGLVLKWSPAPVDCTGESAVYDGQVWCLKTGEDLVQFWEIETQEALSQNDTLSADSLTKRILLTDWKNWRLQEGDLTNGLLTRSMAAPGGDSVDQISLQTTGFRDVRPRFDILHLVKNTVPLPSGSQAWLDSVARLQNLAVGYFNAGVVLRQVNMSDLNDAADRAKALEAARYPDVARQLYKKIDSLQEAACTYFRRAESLNQMLQDTSQLWYVREAAKACPIAEQMPADTNPNNPPPPPPADILLRGRILDADKKMPLPAELRKQILVSAKGLPYGYMLDNARFQVAMPGDWTSPVVLTVGAPGYQQQVLTVRPEEFGKLLEVFLAPQKTGCAEQFLQKARSLMNAGRYEEALKQLYALNSCSDRTAQIGAEVNDLIKKINGYVSDRKQLVPPPTDTVWTLTASAFDANTKEALRSVDFLLLDLTAGTVAAKSSAQGNNYAETRIYPNRRYRIIASVPSGGWVNDTLDFGTDATAQVPILQKVHKVLYLRPAEASEPLLQARVYFEHEQPEPGSKNSITTVRFSELYFDYYAKKDEYVREYTSDLTGPERTPAANAMSDFFDQDLRGSWSNFNNFLARVYDKLSTGAEVRLRISGYTAPVGSSTLNKSLSERRVSAVINEFRSFTDGALVRFLNSGQLRLESASYGEDNAPSGISDNEKDRRNSIFSPRAMRENRVEIQEIRAPKSKK